MAFASNLWNAFLDASCDFAEVVASLEGNDISDVESAEIDPVQPISSSAPHSSTKSTKQCCASDSEHPEATAPIKPQNSNATPHPKRTDTSVEKIDTGDDTEIKSTDHKKLSTWSDECQHDGSAALIKEASQKPSTFRVNQGLSGQIRKLQAQIRDLELEKVRTSDENSRATQEQKNRLQEAETRLEDQKVAAEKAAAAAEAEFSDKSLDAQVEVDTLQMRIRQQDSKIERLEAQAEEACEAKGMAIQEKNDLYHAKVEADEHVERLQAKNQTLESERDMAESKVSGAEGRAKGLGDLLKVTEKSADRWKMAYENAQEDTRDKILSAYAVETPGVSEENQQTFMTASTEVDSTTAVELLREKREIEQKNRQLTAKVEELSFALEEEKRSQEARENDIRRQCSKEKEEALAKARDDIATSQQATTEQDIRRGCQLEMEKALTDERENIRVQWKAWALSLQGQLAVNLKARTKEELKKSRRKASTERKMRSKVNKRQAKCVVRQAVSRAVDVERSLIQKQLRNQFQTELSNYKTKSEAEHAKARTQSESQDGAGSTSQSSLHQEIYKRDQEIESEKEKTKKAYDDMRQSEADHKHVREENQRLSRKVMAYESQESMARQSKSDPQIALTAQDLIRASKLLAETAAMSLDDFHLEQLNELLSANKIISDLRSSIEEGQLLDHEAFQARVDRLMLRSDGFDKLDPRERPTLHAQLEEAYKTVVSLSKILNSQSGDSMKMELLERIYGDKGKGKQKQGTMLGPGAASAPSFASNGGQIAIPSVQADGSNPATSGLNNDQQPGLNNATIPTTTHTPNVHPSSTTPNPTATLSQDGPEYIDSATAHALQDFDQMNEGTAEAFDLNSINWNDPAFLNLDVTAQSFTNQISSIANGQTN